MKRKCIWGIIIGIIILVAYITYIERHLLKVEHVEYVSPNVTNELDGFRIVQFSDTQLGEFYTVEDLERAVNKINELHPDLVVFTGDLIDHAKYYQEDLKDIVVTLDSIQSKYGKYCIYGNHDQGGGAHTIYPDIMEQSGFILLDNETDVVSVGSSELHITGIDDWLLGYPELSDTLTLLDHEVFNLLLIHEPDVADLAANYPVDLQLSGHSHGGQVRLPIIGTLFTPQGAKKYTHGMYGVNQRLSVYVNTGLGNTILPFRLMNIPEITLIELKSK